MEPVVFLERMIVGPKKSTAAPKGIRSATCKPQKRRRRRHRRSLFSYTKTKHSKVKPFEPAETDYFLGFCTATTDMLPSACSQPFCGFSETEILVSKTERRLNVLYGVDMIDEAKTTIASVGIPSSTTTTCQLQLQEQQFVVRPYLKRNIRVLSLFDGISTGLYILSEKLNLNVEAYFSSEIDESALRLQSDRWMGKIVQLGDVRGITEDVLCSLGRIDLVIGVPVMNYLLSTGEGEDYMILQNSQSICRRHHQEYISVPLYCFIPDKESSGHLFFNFVNTRNFLHKRMSLAGVHLFWMFENTTNMKIQTREDISIALGCEPVTLCSSTLVPMARERHFWGNLPAMYDLCTDTTDTMSLHLQDFLRPHRTANFQCSKTITTNKLNQMRGTRLPVTMNGREHFLNVNEIESLMGFSLHYTDACDLSIRQRCNLLAKGWCIPVVQRLFQTLTEFYFTKAEM